VRASRGENGLSGRRDEESDRAEEKRKALTSSRREKKRTCTELSKEMTRREIQGKEEGSQGAKKGRSSKGSPHEGEKNIKGETLREVSIEEIGKRDSSDAGKSLL